MSGFDVEVAIVGGGVGGLAAAYRLGDVDCRVFERREEVGGRTKNVDIDGIRVLTAAGVVYLGTPTERLCEELGIEFGLVVPDTYSCFYRDVTVVARTDGQLIAGLPLPAAAKRDLLRALERMRESYDAYTDHGLNAASDELANQSFLDFIGPLDPAAMEFLAPVVFAHCMAWPEELSAQYGLRYISSDLVRDAEHRGCIPDGMQEIAFGLARRLDGKVKLEHEVSTVAPLDSGGYRLEVTAPGGPETVTAGQVVMAVPGPTVETLVPTLPEWKREAIAGVPSVASLTMGVVLESFPEAAWRDVFFMPTIGCAFDFLVNPKVGPDFPKDDPVILEVGLWRERAVEAFASTDEELERTWLADLERIFPGVRPHVRGVHFERMPACFAVPKVGRDQMLPDVQRSIEGLHFVGDYASGSAGTHGAIESGERVAAEIRTAH